MHISQFALPFIVELDRHMSDAFRNRLARPRHDDRLLLHHLPNLILRFPRQFVRLQPEMLISPIIQRLVELFIRVVGRGPLPDALGHEANHLLLCHRVFGVVIGARLEESKQHPIEAEEIVLSIGFLLGHDAPFAPQGAWLEIILDGLAGRLDEHALILLELIDVFGVFEREVGLAPYQPIAEIIRWARIGDGYI